MTDASIVAANMAMGYHCSVGDILKTQPMNPLAADSGTDANQDARTME